MESDDNQADIEDQIRARQPLIDFTVAGILAVVSLFLAMTRIPSHSEGLMGLGETLEVMYGVLHLVLAGLLFVSAMGAQAQKRWAILLRAWIYYLLVAEGLFWVKVAFAGHGIKLS
jgi:hypothetical protein